MARLLDAIGPLNPVFFDPRRIPLPRDPASLSKYRLLLLSTDLGRFDVLKEIEGVGDYEAVRAQSRVMNVDGADVRVLDIDALIRAKTAAGRDKDKFAIIHLEAIKKRLGPPQQP
jgi:hypothetical protein